jgi:hypothetical protein
MMLSTRLRPSSIEGLIHYYSLDKSSLGDHTSFMEATGHPFLGLEAEWEACITFRKSLLMLASNFLVGTFFSSSRFFLSSNGGSL